jgi:hypothetical protein
MDKNNWALIIAIGGVSLILVIILIGLYLQFK